MSDSHHRHSVKTGRVPNAALAETIRIGYSHIMPMMKVRQSPCGNFHQCRIDQDSPGGMFEGAHFSRLFDQKGSKICGKTAMTHAGEVGILRAFEE